MAKKKIEKVSVNAFEEAVKSTVVTAKDVEWNGMSIKVKPAIGLADMVQFVNNVVENCFDEHGTFVPEVRRFSTAINIISRYTNITLPSNMEKAYELITMSNIVNFVMREICAEQMEEIENAIDEKIAYLVRVNTSELNSKMADAVDSIGKIGESMSVMMNGVSADDLKKAMETLSRVEEKDLVEAVSDKAFARK